MTDPVELRTTAGAELVASLVIRDCHYVDRRGGAVIAAAAGDQSLRDSLESATPMLDRPLVTGAEVLTARPPRVIVTLGDSFTDGNRATLGALRGWPEELARRLAARDDAQPYAVVNAGIAGNRLLNPGWGPSALARLDRDVLRIEGVSHVVLLEGANDIGLSGHSMFGDYPTVTADDLIAAYRQIIARIHDRGIKVVLGTIAPRCRYRFRLDITRSGRAGQYAAGL